MRTFVMFLILLAAYFLQINIAPAMSILGISPDIILALLLAYAMYRGPLRGGILGFVMGAFLDIVFSTSFGFYTMQYMFSGAIAGVAGEMIEADKWLVPVIFAFIGFLLKDSAALLILIMRGLPAQGLTLSYMTKSLSSAVYTSLIMIPVNLFMCKLLSYRFMKKNVSYKKREFI